MGLYRGLVSGILSGILGVWTMAHATYRGYASTILAPTAYLINVAAAQGRGGPGKAIRPKP